MVFAQLARRIQNVIVLGLFLSQLSCGNPGTQPHSAGTPPGSPPPLPRVYRTTPTEAGSALQFIGPVGNLTTFDPNSVPTSRARNGNRTRESAGALIYTVLNGQFYVLIGQERNGGHWNFMRGSVDQGHSYVQAAANEIHEETGGVYQVTPEVLLSESFDVYYSGARINNYACTFFVKLDYVPAAQILQSASTHPDHHFREMNDYAWIQLPDLITALQTNQVRFRATAVLGNTLTFNFYDYSFRLLVQAYNKNIFNHFIH